MYNIVAVKSIETRIGGLFLCSQSPLEGALADTGIPKGGFFMSNFSSVWTREKQNKANSIWRSNNREKQNTYNRRWLQSMTKEQLKVRKESKKRYNIKNNFKKNAHQKIYRALKRGKIKRDNCAVCNSSMTCAHHEDYSKPFDVIWLCILHHRQLHFGKIEIPKIVSKVRDGKEGK